MPCCWREQDHSERSQAACWTWDNQGSLDLPRWSHKRAASELCLRSPLDEAEREKEYKANTIWLSAPIHMLWHCCDTTVTLLWHNCDTVVLNNNSVTVVPHCVTIVTHLCHISATLLSHYCDSGLALLWHECGTTVSRVWHKCDKFIPLTSSKILIDNSQALLRLQATTMPWGSRSGGAHRPVRW